MTEDFELANKNVDEWTATQFWESDPMQQGQSICRIMLYIDWQKKTSIVETQMETNSTDGAVWNGLAGEFTIPEDTDFEEFAEYYSKNIQQIIQAIGNKFEAFWNGSNWKGRFYFEEDENSYGEWSKIENALLDAPKHDKYYFFDVRDSFQQYNEIIDLLKYENIEFLEADLKNDETLDSIIDALLNEEFILINHSREDYRTELELMQESLREEE